MNGNDPAAAANAWSPGILNATSVVRQRGGSLMPYDIPKTPAELEVVINAIDKDWFLQRCDDLMFDEHTKGHPDSDPVNCVNCRGGDAG
jgi:hypothetical protein